MTEREYDAIQYDLSKLLKKVRGGRGRAHGRREEAYEEGVLACKSALIRRANLMGIIKPCPLCRNRYLGVYGGPGSYWIVCKRCGIALSNKTEEAVIAEWNQGLPDLDKPEEKNSSKMPEAVVDFIRRRFMRVI